MSCIRNVILLIMSLKKFAGEINLKNNPAIFGHLPISKSEITEKQ